MLPAIVLPFHDPQAVMLPYLWQLETWLKQNFANVYLGLSNPTQLNQPEAVERLQSDPFYRLTFNPPGSQPGDHYRSVYRSAVEECPPVQRLHLCDFDRPVFALLNGYRQAYLDDLAWANSQTQAVLFQRSPAAWASYPDNYREIERLVTRVGELLYDQSYDFAWSYLVLQAGDLSPVLPQINSHDFGVLIEVLLLLRPRLITRQVDWLAWEDPFILKRGANELRAERSQSRAETIKRLRGMLPLFRHFLEKEPLLMTELVWEKEIRHPHSDPSSSTG
jgi:hypothetical protein